MVSKGQHSGSFAVAMYTLLAAVSVVAVVRSWIVGDVGFVLGFGAIALMAGARVSDLLATLGSLEVAYQNNPTPRAQIMAAAPANPETTATTSAATNQAFLLSVLGILVGLVVVFTLAKVLTRK